MARESVGAKRYQINTDSVFPQEQTTGAESLLRGFESWRASVTPSDISDQLPSHLCTRHPRRRKSMRIRSPTHNFVYANVRDLALLEDTTSRAR
jgi:hypothetical protein